jgi:hypothetical protein
MKFVNPSVRKVGAYKSDFRTRGKMRGRCQVVLRQYGTQDGCLLKRIVTGDESWFDYYQPSTKKVDKEGRHSSLPRILYADICRKSETDAILGSSRPTCRALQSPVPRTATTSGIFLGSATRPKHRGLLSTSALLLGNILPV